MKVRALLNLGSNDYPVADCLEAGEEREVTDALAARMVAAGHAVAVVEKKSEPATPKAAEPAAAKPNK